MLMVDRVEQNLVGGPTQGHNRITATEAYINTAELCADLTNLVRMGRAISTNVMRFTVIATLAGGHVRIGPFSS